MLLRESIVKTKKFFYETLLNLKSLLLGGYHKLSKPPLLSPLSCTIGKEKNRHTDRFYTDFCNEWEHDLEEAKKMKNSMIIPTKELMTEDDASSGRFMNTGKKNPLENKEEEGKREEKKAGSFRVDKKGDQYTCADGYALAQKIKQLDMLDASDVEHVLDIEEALHYYSRLKSPVYVDIVDKFFMDMYSEFSVPQPSASITSSKQRPGSIRL